MNVGKKVLVWVLASVAAIGLYSLMAKAKPPGEFNAEIGEMEES